jgi:hypothetical protein
MYKVIKKLLVKYRMYVCMYISVSMSSKSLPGDLPYDLNYDLITYDLTYRLKTIAHRPQPTTHRRQLTGTGHGPNLLRLSNTHWLFSIRPPIARSCHSRTAWGVQRGRRWPQAVRPAGGPPLKWP